jgi:fructokinase
MNPTILCWGEVLWDLFPDRRRLGGAPANVAYHLAALGARVAMVTRVGDDELGREAVAGLAAAGVDTSLIQIDAARPTGRVEIEVAMDTGEPRYRLTPGCAWEHIEVSDAVRDALSRAEAFCFGTLSQRVRHDQFERALSCLPAACTTVCDPNLRPGHVNFDHVEAALAAARVIKINEHEAEAMARNRAVDASDAVAWLQGEFGVELIALTRGPRGSVLIRGAERVEHPGIAAEPGGDNVGAGDAFTAVLIRLLGLGRPLAWINQAANRYASFVASRRGATPAIPGALRAQILTDPDPIPEDLNAP